ncbi:MAG: hypothetical protein AMXMBFR48_23350 [Ignavibacteriales bacterium]
MNRAENTVPIRRFPLIIPVGIFVVFALSITFAAFYYYFSIRTEVETSHGNTLTSITRLKVRQIQNYHAERLSDARYLYKNAGFSSAVNQFLRNPSGEQENKNMHTWLDQLQKNHNYKVIQLINTGKDVVFATGLRGGLSHEIPIPKNHSLEWKEGPGFIDLHLNKDQQYIHMHTFVPVYYGGSRSTDIIGAVIFTIDPFVFFYPMISESPLPTRTGETILTRADKDSVLYISPLRFYAGNPLELTTNIQDTLIAGVKVLNRLPSFTRGLDYRGAEVLFYGEAVPNLNWMVMTKIDLDEVYAGIRGTSILLFSLLSTLLLMGGGLLYYYIKRQNLRSLQYQAESGLAVAQLNRIYELISLVNTAIARDTSRKDLLKSITGISVDKGGYIFAAITLSEEEATSPLLTSYCGRNPVLPSREPMIYDLIDAVNSAQLSRQKSNIINRLSDGGFSESALLVIQSNNIASLAVFPLTPGGVYRGDIYLFSERADQFSEQETALLEELASDVSFGLHSIQEREKIQQSEQIIKDTELRYRNLIENSPDSILINHRNKIVLANKAAVKLFKAKGQSEIEGKSPLILFSEKFRKSVAQQIRHMRDSGLPVEPSEAEIVCFDGSIAQVEVVAAPYKISNELAIHVILRDITSRKKQEEKLRESEERLRLSLEAANQGIFDLNLQTGETVVNEQYASMLGYDYHTFRETKDTAIDRLHPEDKENCVNTLNGYLHGLIPEYRIEYRSKTADGNWKWLLSMGKVIEWDNSGKPVRMLGTHTDIHKQKEADYQLLLQAKMLEQSGQITAAVSTRGKIVFWNKKAELELGWTPEEVRGKNLLDTLVPATARPDLRQIIRSAALGKSWNGQLVLMRKDSSSFTAEVLISPYYDSNGGQLGLMALAQNITEKLEDHQKINNLSRAVEQSPASIIITKDDGTIIYTNKKVSEVTGYEAEELTGNNFRIFSDQRPEENARYDALMASVLSGNEWHGEFHTKKKNGEKIWETASISPLRNEKGEIVYFLAVKEDISEQKNLIAELIEARDRAEESDKLKTNFLANMSHELRTPLIAILGFSELLLESEPDVEKLDFLKSIYSGGERLLHTVNALLHFSNLQKSGLVLTMAEFSVSDICLGLIQNYKEKSAAKGIAFVHHCSDTAKIITDKALLIDSLGYILENSVRFTQEGTISFSVVNSSDTVTFIIRDTGIGIPEEKLHLIFEEFRQVSEGLSRHYEGSGLGLTLANKYIQILGGHIQVDSQAGKGSEFKVILPAKPQQN